MSNQGGYDAIRNHFADQEEKKYETSNFCEGSDKKIWLISDFMLDYQNQV
jgi:hypothetical protein